MPCIPIISGLHSPSFFQAKCRLLIGKSCAPASTAAIETTQIVIMVAWVNNRLDAA